MTRWWLSTSLTVGAAVTVCLAPGVPRPVQAEVTPAAIMARQPAPSDEDPPVARSRVVDVGATVPAAICAPVDPTRPLPVLELDLFDDLDLRAYPALVQKAPDGRTVKWRGKGVAEPDTDVILFATDLCGKTPKNGWLTATIRRGGKLIVLSTSSPGKILIEERSPFDLSADKPPLNEESVRH